MLAICWVFSKEEEAGMILKAIPLPQPLEWTRVDTL